MFVTTFSVHNIMLRMCCVTLFYYYYFTISCELWYVVPS